MDVKGKLEVIAHLGDHISYKEDIGICYDSDLAKVIEDAYMSSKNGVTVQEWISVKDRLPEHGDVVLCFMKFGEQRILQWDNVSNWWLGYGRGDDWKKADVMHWCCLPQPPKGDSDG